ncbi:CoA-binding protein, partial [Streptomyces sp. NPDC127079]|uniref:CoA-binding protein n=1 Tax=Streptomyces sp. NPDC127079 TaxID=3347132 RepID=UPI003646A06C
MLGSTHGTLTTDSRRARAIACGEQRPGPAVHGRTADEDDLDVSGRPLYADVPDLDRFFRPESVAVIGASDTEGRPNSGITRQLLDWAGRVGARVHPVHPTRPAVFGIGCVPSVARPPPHGESPRARGGAPPPGVTGQAAGPG